MAFLKSVLYVAALGIAAHFIGEALPTAWLRYDRFPCRAWKWERGGKIYDKLGIRRWKDHLPDMSRIMRDMIPKKLGRCPTAADTRRLVLETCRAELVHWGLCLCAPVIYFFWWSWVGVVLSALTVACNLPFILIQRYNRPALLQLAERLELREERKRNARADSVGEHGRGT